MQDAIRVFSGSPRSPHQPSTPISICFILTVKPVAGLALKYIDQTTKTEIKISQLKKACLLSVARYGFDSS